MRFWSLMTRAIFKCRDDTRRADDDEEEEEELFQDLIVVLQWRVFEAYRSTAGAGAGGVRAVGPRFKLLRLSRPCRVSSYSEVPCLVMSYFSPSPQRA